MDQRETVHAVSVGELVRRRGGDAPDPWRLALVQRHETWTPDAMRYLLDSLLADYPVGTLLLCRVETPSRVLEPGDGGRASQDARADEWQLLDGQQRVNALYSMFHHDGRYGRFLLHMGAPRPEPTGPVTSRGRRAAALDHIRWIEQEQDRTIEDRLRIDLSLWYAWAESDCGATLAAALEALASGRSDIVAVLHAIDEAFDASGADLDGAVARARFERLARLWTARTIPVEQRVLRSPMDVLEAFTRVNRGGVPVSGTDLFFAAVKTLWPDAERVIVELTAALTPQRDGAAYDPLVDRMTALRVLARLAARATSRADLLPLAIDRLAGSRGDVLTKEMTRLAAPDSVVRRRMAAVMGSIAAGSSLGFGLYMVDDRLWDPVLGWAAVHPAGEEREVLDAAVPAIDAFLVGASAFRWPEILRDRFGGLAMGEALAAGIAGQPFPTVRIAQVGRGAFPDLAQGRSRIPRAGSEDGRQRLADANAALLLSVVQGLPYRPQLGAFDWDHLYPRALSHRMVSRGPHGWPRHHPDRWLVNSAGNLWGLDASLNRGAQDDPPDVKFADVEAAIGPEGHRIWPTERWWLSADDRRGFEMAGVDIAAGRVDEGMTIFSMVVRGRAQRLVTEVMARLPDAARYAGDAVEDAVPAIDVPDIAEAVGLPPASRPIRDDSGERLPADVEELIGRAAEAGSATELRDLVIRARALGMQVRANRQSVGLMAPRDRRKALITLRPTSTGVMVWAQAHVIAVGYPGRLEALKHQVGVRQDEHHSPADLTDLAGRLELALADLPRVGVSG